MNEAARQERFSLEWISDLDEPDPQGGPATVRSEKHWRTLFSHGEPAEALSLPRGAYKDFVELIGKGCFSYAPKALIKIWGIRAEGVAKGIAALLHDPGSLQSSHSEETYWGELLANVAESGALVSSASGTLSREVTSELRLENERLRTELIEKRREVLLLRQELARINRLQEKLIDSTCDFARANATAMHALTADRGGRMCLSESLEGVVTRVLGEEIEITYETDDGPLKQIYRAPQFTRQRAPAEGEAVRTFAFIAAETPSETPAPESEDEGAADKTDFRRWAKSKPLIID